MSPLSTANMTYTAQFEVTAAPDSAKWDTTRVQKFCKNHQVACFMSDETVFAIKMGEAMKVISNNCK